MKDNLEKRREELGKRDGGFTLMEMLIVVAIIAVLIAIAIPVFTAQLENSRERTDLANVRSAYAEVSAAYLTDSEEHTVTVDATQTQDNWQCDEDQPTTTVGTEIDENGSGAGLMEVPFHVSGDAYTITISEAGIVSCT